jgi:hypothetical protein
MLSITPTTSTADRRLATQSFASASEARVRRAAIHCQTGGPRGRALLPEVQYLSVVAKERRLTQSAASFAIGEMHDI